jgi:hypothetical protein
MHSFENMDKKYTFFYEKFATILSASMDSRFEFEERFDTQLFDGCQKSFSN